MIDKQFFNRHQRNILKFTNSKIGRWFFGLNRLVGDNKVLYITPSSVSVARNDGLYDTYCVSRNVYAINLAKVLFWLPVFQRETNGMNVLRPAYQLAFIFFLTLLKPSFGFLLTTSTFNPVAGTNSPIDGQINNGAGAQSFATSRAAAAGTSASATEGTAQFNGGYYDGNDANSNSIQRAVFHFDTSAIPDTDTISAATFSIYVTSVNNGANTWPGSNAYVGLVLSNPTLDNAIVVADYEITAHWTMTKQGADLAHASLTAANQYYDWILNATGLGNISKTGLTKLGLANGNDIDNVAYTATTNFGFSCQFADAAANLPKLVVTHDGGGGGGGAVAANHWLLMGV